MVAISTASIGMSLLANLCCSLFELALYFFDEARSSTRYSPNAPGQDPSDALERRRGFEPGQPDKCPPSGIRICDGLVFRQCLLELRTLSPYPAS